MLFTLCAFVLLVHVFFFFLMIRRPPRSTRTDTLFPYTTLFRSHAADTGYLVDGERFDGVILATPPTVARRLLQGLPLPPAHADWWQAWPDWSFEPISTISLRMAQPWGLRRARVLLWDRPERGPFGPWLFSLRSEERGVGKTCVST